MTQVDARDLARTPELRTDSELRPKVARMYTPPRVSVVLPARNEEATVGAMVTRLRTDLGERLHELVVIDSDSTDATAQVAAVAGAQVYAVAAIRPELGSHPGKGEALWKAQFVTSGDVLVFLDADLIEWSTEFVPRLVAPFADPAVQLVKGWYSRDYAGADSVETDGGGRVTELMARPWLAVHRPALAQIAQPLAGEWAIRREAFAALSVPCGYGVEIASLLDIEATHGAAAIAQAWLGRRTHRHQNLRQLGVMATQVLAAAARRAQGVTTDPVTLTQFTGDQPLPREVPTTERPPLRELLAQEAC